MQIRSVYATRLDSRSLFGLIVVACILLIGAPELRGEQQFFLPGDLNSTSRVAPVLQADPLNPAIDSAFSRAARILPRTAICVIALDAWHRDYFRASYLLMPRLVWPYQQDLTDRQATRGHLSAALRQRGATCLLAASHVPVPSAVRLASQGVYNLYLVKSSGGLT